MYKKINIRKEELFKIKRLLFSLSKLKLAEKALLNKLSPKNEELKPKNTAYKVGTFKYYFWFPTTTQYSSS